jgi:hypothetical protein
VRGRWRLDAGRSGGGLRGGRRWTLDGEQGRGRSRPRPASSVDVLDLLTSLVEKSLVLYEESESSGRYRLLETIRQYAAEKLRDAALERCAARATR